MSASSSTKEICWKSITIWRRDSNQVTGDRCQGTDKKKTWGYHVFFLLFMGRLENFFVISHEFVQLVIFVDHYDFHQGIHAPEHNSHNGY